MNLNKLQSSGAFDEVTGVIGKPVAFDLIDKTVTILVDEENTVVADLGNVIFLEEVGTLKGIAILEGDVLSGGGQKYEVELLDNGKDIVLHQLDSKLERIKSGEAFDKNTLESIADMVDLIGNIYELRNELNTIDFNIRVLRFFDGDDTIYYYACNNKETEEIEMIKVIYVGHMLLEEELYERENISYDEYQMILTTSEWKEVSPNELGNYVLGMSGVGRPAPSAPHVDVDNLYAYDENDTTESSNDVEAEDYCDECGEGEEDCECHSWDV